MAGKPDSNKKKLKIIESKQRTMKLKYLILIMAIVLVSCKDETKVKEVTLNPTEMTLAIGETRQIELLIDPLSSQIYNQKYWSSSDENVAVVDGKGNVTGVYAGTCTITASVGGIKATCQVTVTTPTYYLKLENGIVFNNGIDEESGSSIKILRLFEEGLDIDSVGNVSGNGLMLNLYICSNATTEALVEGIYQVNESKMPFTVLPGELKQEDESTYATGSFLGQYSDYGLSVLFAKSGLMKVSKDGEEYTVECVMEGSLNEHIEATFRGEIAAFRGDTTYEVKEFNYTNVSLKDTILENETMLKHTILTFDCGKEQVVMTLRMPKSAKGQIMEGRYTLSGETESYTIMEGATIGELEIISGTLDITKGENETYIYNGSFRTKEGGVRLCSGK